MCRYVFSLSSLSNTGLIRILLSSMHAGDTRGLLIPQLALRTGVFICSRARLEHTAHGANHVCRQVISFSAQVAFTIEAVSRGCSHIGASVRHRPRHRKGHIWVHAGGRLSRGERIYVCTWCTLCAAFAGPRLFVCWVKPYVSAMKYISTVRIPLPCQ